MIGMMIAAVIGAAAFVLIFALVQPKRICPECGTVQPKIRPPRSFHEFLWGGGACPKCGTKLDREGKRIAEKKN